MSSQPIVVPGGEHRNQSDAQLFGNATDSYKTMTPPTVSRSLSNRKYE